MHGFIGVLVPVIIIVAVALIIWYVAERFSPDPLITKVVQIVLPGHDDDMTRLSEIAETYKARFKQQSVITIVRPVCVSF